MLGKEEVVASVGAYGILRQVGREHGLGERVYLARRADDPDPRFLLKRYAPRGLPRARVLRDLRHAKRLAHPTGATLADHFEAEGDLVAVYRVDEGLPLELVLNHLLREGERFSDDATWYVARQLFAALAETHELDDERGRPLHAAHGRLAPGCVHLSWNGQVQVVGLAAASLFEGEESSPMTRAYLPPEHKPGTRPSARGDLYGAALIVWALLTGRQPKEGAAPEHIKRFRPDVPDELARALDTALQASPLKRTASCRGIEQLIAAAIDSSDSPTELTWNMEVFRDLPPAVLATPPQEADDEAATAKPRISGQADETTNPAPSSGEPGPSGGPRVSPDPVPGARRLVPARRDPLSSGSDDSTVRRLADLFDALPVGTGTPPPTGEDDDAWLVDVVRKTAPGPAPPERPSETGPEPTPKPSPVAGPVVGRAPPGLPPRDDPMPPSGDERQATLPDAPAPVAAPPLRPLPEHPDEERLDYERDPSFEMDPRLSAAEVVALEASLEEIRDDPHSPPPPKPSPSPPGAVPPPKPSPPRAAPPAKPSTPRAAAPPAKPSAPSGAPSPRPSAPRGTPRPAAAAEAGPVDEASVDEVSLDEVSVEDAVSVENAKTAAATLEDAVTVAEEDVPVDDEASADADAAAAAKPPALPAPPAAPVMSVPSPLPARDSEPPSPPMPAIPPAPPVPAMPPAPPAPPAAVPAAVPAVAAAPKGHRSWAVTVAGAAFAASLALGAAWLLKNQSEPPADPDTTSTAHQPATAAPTATATTMVAATTATATAAATASARASEDAGTADASAEDASAEDASAADASAASEAEDAGALPSGDLPEVVDEIGKEPLLSFEGFLIVRSPVTAEVFVQGVHRGLTNHKLRARCHQKNVRLRDPKSMLWITDGEPVRIACMDTTTVVINP